MQIVKSRQFSWPSTRARPGIASLFFVFLLLSLFG
jgi:hypothetical protein